MNKKTKKRWVIGSALGVLLLCLLFLGAIGFRTTATTDGVATLRLSVLKLGFVTIARATFHNDSNEAIRYTQDDNCGITRGFEIYLNDDNTMSHQPLQLAVAHAICGETKTIKPDKSTQRWDFYVPTFHWNHSHTFHAEFHSMTSTLFTQISYPSSID